MRGVPVYVCVRVCVVFGWVTIYAYLDTHLQKQHGIYILYFVTHI